MEMRKSPLRRPAFMTTPSPEPENIPNTKPTSGVYVSKTSGQRLEILASAKGWHEKVVIFNPPDALGLKSNLHTYNGRPIYIVPKEMYNEVASTFVAGNYGVDTESDFHTHELRLIQIYTGTATYIFGADALDVNPLMGLPKFFRGKDRIKIGIDIETDARRIHKHMEKYVANQEGYLYTKPFTINGIVDLQNISRSISKKIKAPISMKDLALEYVPEFTYVDGFHDSYLAPTDKQYVYAANDAVIPYIIHERMCKH